MFALLLGLGSSALLALFTDTPFLFLQQVPIALGQGFVFGLLSAAGIVLVTRGGRRLTAGRAFLAGFPGGALFAIPVVSMTFGWATSAALPAYLMVTALLGSFVGGIGATAVKISGAATPDEHTSLVGGTDVDGLESGVPHA